MVNEKGYGYRTRPRNCSSADSWRSLGSPRPRGVICSTRCGDSAGTSCISSVTASLIRQRTRGPSRWRTTTDVRSAFQRRTWVVSWAITTRFGLFSSMPVKVLVEANTTPSSSTAATLVRRGVAAVVAMQYEITDAASIEFSRSFYDAVADGLPVDVAVADARKSVSVAIANTLEWGTPVLFMRSRDGKLFRFRRRAANPIVEIAAAVVGLANDAATGLESNVVSEGMPPEPAGKVVGRLASAPMSTRRSRWTSARWKMAAVVVAALLVATSLFVLVSPASGALTGSTD